MGIVNGLKKDYTIKDKWVGLEIHPETPDEGVILAKRFGKDSLQVIKQRLTRTGEKYSVKFGKLDLMPNSHNSLEAAEYARSVGKFDEYHRVLMDAYFRDSKNIGDIEVLIELGNSIGLEQKDLSNAIRTRNFESILKENSISASELSINSTPTFVINDEYTIVGAQSIEVFRNLFHDIKGT